MSALDVQKKDYNEYKFLVTNEALPFVLDVLQALYGGSDPFPEGIVDSIYFDTADGLCRRQCEDGLARKVKFRIRGYGDDSFNQVHRKERHMAITRKQKQRIVPIHCTGSHGPDWHALTPGQGANDAVWRDILQSPLHNGDLRPVIRVRYYRYRFRVKDTRITLDTRIEVSGFDSGLPGIVDYAVLPQHVLEVKTEELRPHLPLMGLVKLPQISFSKFGLGLEVLDSQAA